MSKLVAKVSIIMGRNKDWLNDVAEQFKNSLKQSNDMESGIGDRDNICSIDICEYDETCEINVPSTWNVFEMYAV